ncbi:MAG: catalase family peroxidase [Acidimicrobiales bacterium]
MGDPLAARAVDALNAFFGRHEGQRAVHAKGLLCAGTFTPTADAAAPTTAAHLQGDPVPVVARFSNASGNPEEPDYARDGRGLAVKFTLPDGSKTDIVSVNVPVFLVRTPEDFVRFIRAARPIAGTPLPGPRLAWFLATHRESWRAVRLGATMKPPASFATITYHAIHAFRWIDAAGTSRHVRHSWIPEAGDSFLSRGEAKARGRDYLGRELGERLERGPVRFTLRVQLAADGDPTDDPTATWPDDRDIVDAGTLELTGLETGREQGSDVLVFDPTRVTPGIELSDDPVLRFRTHAYSASVERRSGVARPPALG